MTTILRRSVGLSLALSALLLAGCSTSEPPAPAESVDVAAFAFDLNAWRADRVERLRQPGGWLSLVGLHWVEEGTQTIGSGEDADIRLATGPAMLGAVMREGDAVRFAPAPGTDIVVDDAALTEAIALASDQTESPTVLRFDGGEASLVLIERSGRFGLRVRDARAPTRTGFTRIDYFPADPAWRFDARFEPHPPGRTIDIANVIGSLDPMPNPGAVIFEKDGQPYRLEAVDEGDGRLFLIFADRTNGKTTYGAGRFLYAEPAVEGRTVVDFNRAYNPPCAFNAYSTCPLPPPENRLDLAVTAGEKTYTGPTH